MAIKTPRPKTREMTRIGWAARRVARSLPIHAFPNLGGDEIYALEMALEKRIAHLALSERSKALREKSWDHNALVRKAAACVPNNWCDPILTGGGAIKIPADALEIEKLLNVIRFGILALSNPGRGKRT